MKQPEDQFDTGLVRRNPDDEQDPRSLRSFREQRFAYSSEIEPEADSGNHLGLRDYWAMVRDRLWMILALSFLITVLAMIYASRLPDVYEAEANIQVDVENNPALGTLKDKSVVIQGDDDSYFNTQLLLLKSPAFLRRVVKTLDLEHDRQFFSPRQTKSSLSWRNLARSLGADSDPSLKESAKPLRAEVIAPPSADGAIAEAQRLAPYVEAIRSNQDVRLTEATRLISIKFRHPDPGTAARVANVIADTFVQASWERRGATNSSASDFLQKRIAELQFKIAENEKRVIDYAKQHQVLPPDSGRDMLADRLAALDKGLLEAESQRKFAEAEYHAALAPGAAAALVEASNSGALSSINSRLADFRQKREVMLLETGENWPEVKELNKQIANLETELKETREHAIGVVLTNLETRYRQALAREQDARKSFNQQHSETLNQDEAAINYRMIQQETTTYRGLLENMLQRSKENDVVLAATPNNVHVTDYATLPSRLVGPTRPRLVGLAFGVSLALGIGLAILLGSMDDNVPVGSVERAEKMFGLPSLGVLPNARAARKTLPGLRWFQKRNGHDHALLLGHESGSPFAEAYRKLRTSVLLSSGGAAPKSLLVTSSFPSEGKTTVVINTGLVVAQTGSKVLLVDADLRHPSLHTVLGADNSFGLSTILSKETTEVEALSMIDQYADTDLYILPAGPLPDNPAELLGSERMKSLIRTLGATFTHIIIDSPPISYFTDAVLLSAEVDGVLVIVRGPKSSRQVAQYSLRSLEAVGAPILGVVLNDVNLKGNDYAYYRGYYRQLGGPVIPPSVQNGHNGNGHNGNGHNGNGHHQNGHSSRSKVLGL
jgi:polysaccharide biosynthesis transport protein